MTSEGVRCQGEQSFLSFSFDLYTFIIASTSLLPPVTRHSSRSRRKFLSSQPALHRFKRGSHNWESHDQVAGPPIIFLVGYARPLSRGPTTSPAISHPSVISLARTERTRGRVLGEERERRSAEAESDTV